MLQAQGAAEGARTGAGFTIPRARVHGHVHAGAPGGAGLGGGEVPWRKGPWGAARAGRAGVRDEGWVGVGRVLVVLVLRGAPRGSDAAEASGGGVDALGLGEGRVVVAEGLAGAVVYVLALIVGLERCVVDPDG